MSNNPIDIVLPRLYGVHKSGQNQWTGQCPGHGDTRASLSIAVGDDGRVLMNCHAGCETNDVVKALGLKMRDLFPSDNGDAPLDVAPSPAKTVVTPKKTYPSADAAITAAGWQTGGTLVRSWTYPGSAFVVARFGLPDGGKSFRPISRNGDGWYIGDPPGPLPLYRGDLISGTGPVVICEGEKAADAAASVGLSAVTSAHGAKSASKSEWNLLAGKEVIILPDNDTAGQKYAQDVAEILSALSPPAVVRIVNLPGLPEHGDIVEWISPGGPMAGKDAGEVRSAILNLAQTVAVWAPPALPGAKVGEPLETTKPDGGDDIEVPSVDPVPLAKAMVKDTLMDASGRVLVRRYRDEFFSFEEPCYRPIPKEKIDVDIYHFLGRVVFTRVDPRTRQVVRARIPVTSSDVRELRLALPSCSEILLDDRLEAPCWLDDRTTPDPRGIAVFRNGFLDLATGVFSPPDPMLFTTSACDFDYASNAPAPARWLGFLESVWGDDQESIELLQDWFGYLLGSDTRHHKILLDVGPKRSGKGVTLRLLTELLGRVNCCSPTLASLSQNFGLQSLIGKRAAFITDARLSSRADQAAIAERLLSISGEDDQTVDRKYLVPWTGRIGARFTICTNELPRLGDASGALSSRFLLLKRTRSFYKQEDLELTGDLLEELSGIFHWAWAGWKRLQTRGRFIMPKASADALQELEDLISPVAAFVRDECEVGPEKWVACGTLYERWRSWCETQGREHPGTAATFGRDLAASVPNLLRSRKIRHDGGRFYAYEGIQ